MCGVNCKYLKKNLITYYIKLNYLKIRELFLYLKCAFGESYNDLYPGTIYSPPSYDVRFPSAIMSS